MDVAIAVADKSRHDADALREISLQSLTLAIELFNRPSDCARSHAVIILLHHSMEILLKSIIVSKKGSVFDDERGYSYGFDKCLTVAQDENVITADHRKYLSILDNVRDGAVHYRQTISEPILYIFSQATVSLFNDLIKILTGKGLLEYLPHRAVAVSAMPPQALGKVLDQEFEELRLLLHRPDTNTSQAIAMLRPLMAFQIGGEEQHRRMKSAELEETLKKLTTADTWRVVFPEIAKVQFDSSGDDIIVGFKVVKESADALPVRVLGPGAAHLAKGVIIQKEVNIFDKFNMGLPKLAENLGTTQPKALAMIRELNVQADAEMFREVRIGKTTFRRYSKKALDFLRSRIETIGECWAKRRKELTGGGRK